MPHDLALAAEVRAWLSKAARDLAAADALAVARAVFEAVLSRLPSDARP